LKPLPGTRDAGHVGRFVHATSRDTSVATFSSRGHYQYLDTPARAETMTGIKFPSRMLREHVNRGHDVTVIAYNTELYGVGRCC
jgi:hypothetical protein